MSIASTTGSFKSKFKLKFKCLDFNFESIDTLLSTAFSCRLERCKLVIEPVLRLHLANTDAVGDGRESKRKDKAYGRGL